MNTRPYTDLLGLVEALCGATLAEQLNMRCHSLHRECSRTEDCDVPSGPAEASCQRH